MDVKTLLDEIYPRLDRLELVKGLDPKERGSYYEVACPKCGQREAYLYKNGTVIKCSRLNNCGYSISLWDYLQQGRGLTSSETLQELARLANYTLPALEGYSYEQAERTRKQTNLMEAALTYFQAQLTKNQETLDYLQGRGYSPEDIKGMGLGYFPGKAKTEKYLKENGYGLEDIKTVIKWIDYREDYKLVIPYRDQVGRLVALYGRLTRALKDGEKEADKYKPFTDAEGVKDTPLNLDRARNQEDIIIVEGLLDALISRERGISNIVAIGQARLMDRQAEALIKANCKRAILALDNDKAGIDGTEAAIKLLAAKGLNIFVVSLEGYKDPDELIKAEGIEAFKKLVDQAPAASRWIARRILSQYDITTDRGQQQAIEAAIQYVNGIQDPLEGKQFLETICQGLDIPYEALAPRIMAYEEKQARENQRKEYKDLLTQADQLHRDNKLKELGDLLSDRVQGIKAQAGAAHIVTPYTVADMITDITRTSPGLKTGYDSLDKLITIPQEAITIIAGRPSHGKTTLMLNLILKMVENYPDKTFLFFSYEETRKQITLKLLDILSQRVISEAQNLNQIENYIRASGSSQAEIEAGKQKLADLTGSGRLWIIDEPFYINDLEEVIANLASKHQLGAVFVDYIQKVKIKGKYGTRQLELQAISDQLLGIAKQNSLPLIMGAQFSRDKDSKDKVKLDNLREAGDIEQDANLVIGLYNEAMQKAQDEDRKLTARTVNIDLTILKNRNGAVNDKVTLIFDRPILTMREPGPGENIKAKTPPKTNKAPTGWEDYGTEVKPGGKKP